MPGPDGPDRPFSSECVPAPRPALAVKGRGVQSNGPLRAFADAPSTADAALWIHGSDLLDRDGADRTGPFAHAATEAFLRINHGDG